MISSSAHTSNIKIGFVMVMMDKTNLIVRILLATTFVLFCMSTHSAESSADEELKKSKAQEIQKMWSAIKVFRAHTLDQQSKYEIGTDFTLLPPKHDNLIRNQQTILVTHFFTYTCSQCLWEEPYIRSWRKTLPDNVTYLRLPSTFGVKRTHYAKVYFALQKLGQHKVMHERIVDAIANKTAKLDSLDAAADFLAKNGVDGDQFREHYASFGIARLVKQLNELEKELKLPKIPTLVVNGVYLVSHSSHYSTPESEVNSRLNVVDYLISVEQEVIDILHKNEWRKHDW